jgi:hypothetical protein
LTDGWNWIELDGHVLLRYSDRRTARFQLDRPYVDYQVVRLWEDLISLIPAVLEPVPADLLEFIASDQHAWPDSESDQALEAGWWYGERQLDLGYLRDPPSIRCWRTIADDTDTVTVAWQHRTGSDIEFAAPLEGQVSIPTDSFVAAVHEFDRALLAAMRLRVAELERDGPPRGVRIDMDHLRFEQRDRATWLRNGLTRPRDTDWDAIRTGARELLSQEKRG